jgi:LAO/AO transport system kinase
MISKLPNLKGQPKRRLARFITQLECERVSKSIAGSLRKKAQGAFVVGITGVPGAGKSTLSSQLIRALAQKKKKIAFVACDPSSPYSGGAFLGDRVRMSKIPTDKNIFIRSMATRGHLGGLAKSTPYVCGAFAHAGFKTILVESVGVGQSETDIVHLADITLVVLTPEYGDSIQLAKAGLLEIADLVVINKADHDHADRIEQALLTHQALSRKRRPLKVFKTIATRGKGIHSLVSWIEKSRKKK